MLAAGESASQLMRMTPSALAVAQEPHMSESESPAGDGQAGDGHWSGVAPGQAFTFSLAFDGSFTKQAVLAFSTY